MPLRASGLITALAVLLLQIPPTTALWPWDKNSLFPQTREDDPYPWVSGAFRVYSNFFNDTGCHGHGLMEFRGVKTYEGSCYPNPGELKSTPAFGGLRLQWFEWAQRSIYGEGAIEKDYAILVYGMYNCMGEPREYVYSSLEMQRRGICLQFDNVDALSFRIVEHIDNKMRWAYGDPYELGDDQAEFRDVYFQGDSIFPG